MPKHQLSQMELQRVRELHNKAKEYGVNLAEWLTEDGEFRAKVNFHLANLDHMIEGLQCIQRLSNIIEPGMTIVVQGEVSSYPLFRKDLIDESPNSEVKDLRKQFHGDANEFLKKLTDKARETLEE